MRIETIQKYFIVACCDGVASRPRSGSSLGTSPVACSRGCVANHQARAPIPARSARTLTPVQTTLSPVGTLSMSGSCGQLLVYVIVSFGRFVDAAHADQKKNVAICRACSALE